MPSPKSSPFVPDESIVPDKSFLEAARRELECSMRRAVDDYKASTGRVVESIDVTTEGVRARTREPNDIDIAMGWA